MHKMYLIFASSITFLFPTWVFFYNFNGFHYSIVIRAFNCSQNHLNEAQFIWTEMFIISAKGSQAPINLSKWQSKSSHLKHPSF
jgi:hypothetical protein